MSVYRDQLNREVKVGSVQRIVSLVPSQTELLVDLGLRKQIVGVTKFCVHPEDLRKEKKIVGGTKQVHFHRIKELEPDIILCNKEENTREMVEELVKISPVHVSNVRDISSSMELIMQYGRIFSLEKKAETLNRQLEKQVALFSDFIKDVPVRRVAYMIWKKPWMVAGGDNFIDYLLELNHFENVFREKDSRYPEVTLKDLYENKVEILLLSTEPFPFGEKHKRELQEQLPGIKIEIVDGEYYSWYGSRLIGAFEYFKKLHRDLYPS